jgi:diguanylate cyclase (GGDEF)-like protein
MSGAGFILAINMVVAGLLVSAFMMIAAYDSRQACARWMALAYGLGMLYAVIEFGITTLETTRLAVVLSFAVLLAAMAVLNVGVARKYEAPAPRRLMILIFVVSTIMIYFVQDLPRQSFWRIMAYQTPYALISLLGANIVWSKRRPGSKLDLNLVGLFCLGAVQFLSKPFIAYAAGGWGANPQFYLQSNYALFSQSLGTVFTLAVALMIMAIIIRDMLSDVALRSEMDALSGLLNRGGFERRAETALNDARRQGLPLALVICDLDHFKDINDNFGHAAGDGVIRTFAGFLRAVAANNYVAGRIGGEEFAIILPGANLAAARLFAEGLRSACAGVTIEGAPEGCRFTASFGVAELAPNEQVSDILVRADKALYDAKKSGRDCVRISLPRAGGMTTEGGFSNQSA